MQTLAEQCVSGQLCRIYQLKNCIEQLGLQLCCLLNIATQPDRARQDTLCFADLLFYDSCYLLRGTYKNADNLEILKIQFELEYPAMYAEFMLDFWLDQHVISEASLAH